MNEENKQSGSLFSGQEPHQKEDMDQASRASEASFSLETEKGLTPDAEEYNQGEESGNVRQVKREDDADADRMPGEGIVNIDDAEDDPDLDAGEYDVDSEDLKGLEPTDDDDSL